MLWPMFFSVIKGVGDHDHSCFVGQCANFTKTNSAKTKCTIESKYHLYKTYQMNKGAQTETES